MSKKLFLLISFVVVLGLVGSAAAVTKNWTGAVSTDWFDGGNWDPEGVPERGWDTYTGDEVIIDGGKPNYPVISTTDPCATCKKLQLGTIVDSGDAYLTIESGGELTVRSYDIGIGNQTIVLGKANGTNGYLTMTGGTINMVDGEQFEIGGRSSWGEGTFDMTGGKVNNGNITLPGFGGEGTSVLNLDGGVIDCNDFGWPADTRGGTLNLYSGTIICDYLGFHSGGYFNLYGGEIHSFTWKMYGNYGGFDIYDGVWYNYTQGLPDGDQRRMTYDVRYYTNSLNDEGGYCIVTYGGRGNVAIEWTNMNDPCNPVVEGDLTALMDYTDANTYDPNIHWWVRADFDSDLAYWENPADTYAGASPEQTLHWTPAYTGNATHHDVYFGTSFDDVNDASIGDDPNNVYFGRRDTNSITRVEYNPAGILVMGPTYYWRIDEVNDAELGSPWKGDIWSFSISYVSIDNFESYANDTELKVEWKDYYDSENSTWCFAASRDDQALDSRSMYLTCMNGSPAYYAEVWHNFAQDQDWSPAGTDARLLAMSYYGKINNEDAGIYMKLKDSLGTEATQWISKDPNTCKVASWTEAILSLNGFGGVDMSKISRVTIGVGLDPPVQTGTSQIWVDNVRLYLPRCDTSYLRAPGDINGNCTTDFSDLNIMVAQGSWLVSNLADVEVIAPVGDPCLWYKFDGNSVDSSGNGYDGTVTDPCDPNYVTGQIGQALVFNGSTIEPTHVDVPLGFLSTIDREITVSVWLNSPLSGTQTVFAGEPNEGAWGERILYLTLLGDTADVFIGNETYADPNGAADSLSRGTGTDEFVDLWTHWAVTKDCDANEMAIYVNGEMLTSESYHLNGGSYNVAIAGIYSFLLGCNVTHDNPYEGMIDDFRVYDYALSHGEILALAGEPVASTFSQPFSRLLMTSANINLYDDVAVDVIDFKDYAVLANTWLQWWIYGDYPDGIYRPAGYQP